MVIAECSTSDWYRHLVRLPTDCIDFKIDIGYSRYYCAWDPQFEGSAEGFGCYSLIRISRREVKVEIFPRVFVHINASSYQTQSSV